MEFKAGNWNLRETSAQEQRRSEPLLQFELRQRRSGADGHPRRRAAKERNLRAVQLRRRPSRLVHGHPVARLQVAVTRDVEVLPLRPGARRAEEVVPLHDVDQPRDEKADEVCVPPCPHGLGNPPGDERRYQRAGHGVLHQVLLPLLPWKIFPHSRNLS
jgi:hypothetical protein